MIISIFDKTWAISIEKYLSCWDVRCCWLLIQSSSSARTCTCQNLPRLGVLIFTFSGLELNIICRNQFGQTELAEEHKGCTSFIAGIKGADTMLLHLFIPFQIPPHQTKNHLLSNKTIFFPKISTSSDLLERFLRLTSKSNYNLLFSVYARRNNIS